MELKKVIVFDDKMFYNAKHLFRYLNKYYIDVHKVTYYQVQDATGKRLKSIDKFFKVTYEDVPAVLKNRIKRYMQIDEGFEDIVAFEAKTFDDFIIKYLGVKDVGYMFTFRNPKKEIMLAYKIPALTKLAKLFDKDLFDLYVKRIIDESFVRDNFYYYKLSPTPIKQNIF